MALPTVSTRTERPGTRYHAPQARLVDEQGQAIKLAGQGVSQDIVSAKVTRVASGVSQVDVVLNNQRHDSEHRPLVPSWRYNGLERISFGTRMRVDFRYGDEPWTPMILARITDVNFLFPQATGAQLTLQGEDLLSLLKIKPDKDVDHKDVQEADIVQKVVEAAKIRLPVRATAPTPPFSSPLALLTHQTKMTYLQFIESMAERMDYEVYVDFDTPGEKASKVSLHFEPARSGIRGEPVVLKWGRDLIDFKPAFKVWDLLTEAVASGTKPGKRARYTQTVKMADAIMNDLHTGSDGRKPLSAASARETAFNEENKPESHSEPLSETNLDEDRAKLHATAVLRRSARQFLTADITTLGRPDLRPGVHVELGGFREPFDGVYYVTQTVHTLSTAGYLTVSSLRRPGMLDPRGYGKA